MPEEIVEILAEGAVCTTNRMEGFIPENIIIAFMFCVTWVLVSYFKGKN